MAPNALQLFRDGFGLHRAGRFVEAAERYEQALALDPNLFDALQLLGQLRFRGGEVEAGLALFERAIAIEPRHTATLNNYGNALQARGRSAEAVVAYRRALESTSAPAPVIFRNLGIALADSGEVDSARTMLERAVVGDATDTIALVRLGFLGIRHREWTYAKDRFEAALRLKFSIHLVLARRMCLQNLADWAGFDADLRSVTSATPPDDEEVDPFRVMFLTDSARVQRRYADAYARYGQTHGPHTDRRAMALPPRSRRLRLAYLSADIRRHPVAQLLAGVLEQHDRRIVEVTVHAYGAPSTDPERDRIRAASDHFIDHGATTDQELAATISASEPDVLVDLMGYSDRCRPSVLLARPASQVVGWLGYPGTLGMGVLDTIIADPYVIPAQREVDYAERVLRLPDCYLPADRSRRVAAPRARSEYGLPDDALVVACFGQIQKITPQVFDIWMDFLAEEPRAILWLFNAVPEAVENLRRSAVARGVAGHRLVFASFADEHADHLARYEVADFALDTFPYGSHTTAIDALWVGCPLVGWSGEAFASRVSGSVLRAAGVPELIAESAAEYRRLIRRLASDTAWRESLRARLVAARETSALFDVAAFTRHFEELLQSLVSTPSDGPPTSSGRGDADAAPGAVS